MIIEYFYTIFYLLEICPDLESKRSKDLDYIVKFDDNGTIIDALSTIDKEMIENPKTSIYPLYKRLIHCYLQLIWEESL